MSVSKDKKLKNKSSLGSNRTADEESLNDEPETPDLTKPIPFLNYDEANDWLTNDRAFLLDVREKIQILNTGRIKNSVRISVFEIVVNFALNDKDFFYKYCNHKPSPKTPIVVYCQSGQQAPIAAEKLRKLGYFEVGVLAGGLKHWIEFGGDVERCPDRNFHFSGFY